MNVKMHSVNIIKRISKYMPRAVKKLFRNPVIKILRIIKADVYFFYDNYFAISQSLHKKWTHKFRPLIEKYFDPKLIIDFGCGSGDFLAPFEKKGIEILGIDGSIANSANLEINKNNFQLFDIRNPYNPKKKYDLCLCLEVAEHVEEKYSDILISNLTSSSATLLFSAAPPGQIGQDHINLKPFKWWIDKFEQSGFQFEERLTRCLKEEMRHIYGVEAYYIDNLLIFKKAK